jgi:hypothetical protein
MDFIRFISKSGNHFQKPKPKLTARCTRYGAPEPTTKRDPRVNWSHPSAEAEQGVTLTDEISPSARSPAERSPLTAPSRRATQDALEDGSTGASVCARRRRWRHGGTAHWWLAVSSHGEALTSITVTRRTRCVEGKKKGGRAERGRRLGPRAPVSSDHGAVVETVDSTYTLDDDDG